MSKSINAINTILNLGVKNAENIYWNPGRYGFKQVNAYTNGSWEGVDDGNHEVTDVQIIDDAVYGKCLVIEVRNDQFGQYETRYYQVI